MADGNSYPYRDQDASGNVRQAGTLVFEDSANQPAPQASPTFTGTVTLPAAVVGSALPTADPHVAGQLWANAGVVTVSAG